MIRHCTKSFSKRPIIDESERRDMTVRLARKIAPFGPSAIVYIEEGGERVGRDLARELGIPACGIDISYPMSRMLNRKPAPVRALLWPLKELVYKVGGPSANRPFGDPCGADRVVLVDDSASSGRTIAAALRMLERAGIGRSRIKTATLRCGIRARSLVDFFETEEPVLWGDR